MPNEQKCPLISQYQHDYQKHAINRVKPIKREQCDKAVISGYLGRNLQVNGKSLKTKVWPQVTLGFEEYDKFLKRLACCKKEVYKMYYDCQTVDLNYIESLLKSLEKTVYQCSYSPKEYWPLKDSLRFSKTAHPDSKFKYYETIYQTYYNRIKELEHYRPVMRGKITKPRDNEALRQDLKKLYKPCGTTYFMDLCLPAIANSKKAANRTEEPPIDQYTLRRI